MVAIEWIDIIFGKKNTQTNKTSMILQAYDFDGAIIFEKEVDATLKEAEETINHFNKGMKNSELYDWR